MASERRVDARLIPAAAAVWLVTWCGLGSAASVSFGLAVAAGVGGAAALLLRRPWTSGAVLCLGCAAAAAVAVGVRVDARESSPLRELADQRAYVTVHAVVRDDPRQLDPGRGPPRVLVPVTVRQVQTADRQWRLSARMLLFAPRDGWSELLPSQEVTVQGRLDRPYGGDLTVAVLVARGPPEEVGRASVVQRAAGSLRTGLREAAGVLPAKPGGLLPGLVIGDTSRLDPGVEEDFRTTGLTHLVAVSGANCAIVAGAALLAARAMRCGPRTAAVVAGLALLGFVILARPSASVVRAAAMGALALVALASGRPRAALPALAAAVIGLLLYSPELARSAGFAMSVVATAALIVVAPQWAAGLRRRGVPIGIAEALAVAAAASLATAPLIAAISGQVSLVAVPANLFAAPAVPPATVLGVLAAAVAPASGGLAAVLAWIAGWPTRWLVLVATYGARAPSAAVGWLSGWPGAGLAMVALAGIWLLLRRPGRMRTASLAAVVGAAAVVIPLRVATPGWPPKQWALVACDVGEGDALALRTGAHQAIVIDTSLDPAMVDGCLRRLDVDEVPLLVITHLHADHVGGLLGVLGKRSVGAVVTGPLQEPAEAWEELVTQTRRYDVPLVVPPVGRQWQLGGITMTVLGPEYAMHGTHSDPNNASLILRVETAGQRMLLTGDAEIEEEEALLRAGVDLRADVLKVAHHGSSYVDPRFLDAVDPDVAVISVGADNDYGHPAASVLRELAAHGTQIYRTDTDGDVAIGVHDDELVVTTQEQSGRKPEPVPGGAALPAERGTTLSAGRATMTPCRHPRCVSSSVRTSFSPLVRLPRSSSPRAPPILTATCGTSPRVSSTPRSWPAW